MEEKRNKSTPMEIEDAETSPGNGDSGYNAEPVTKYREEDDEALKAFANLGGEPTVLDAATRKRLLRTIDWHLMPVLCLVFGLNYLDKTSLSYASIMGMQPDLHLKGDEYQWLGSIFYLGFLVWEYPTNRLMQLLPLARYSATCVTLWGVILCLFAVVNSWSGAMAIRFFMGLFEAASMPGFALISSQWYTHREHNTRTGIYISSNGGGQIIGGLVAYGISRGVEEHTPPLAAWKIIFIATGCFTVFVGLLFFYIVPDSQVNCRWLSKSDRLLAIERVRENEQGIGNRHFKAYQFKEALLDPLTWALFMYGVLSDIPNGGITNYFSQLIVNFGYTQQQSLLYGIPGGGVVIVACLANGMIGDYFQQRTLVACVPMLCATIGMLLIIALPLHNNVGRLIGYYMTQTLPSIGATILSLISSNIAGYTKKTTVAAIYMVGYAAGNIIGPQTFRPKDAPRYVSAEITILVCFALCIVDLLFINWWCRRENRRKAAIRAEPGYVPVENHEWRDMTDRENPQFVYCI
ncbi:MFS allantoate transporter [Niveomyces insectorum RCEF 264]|uniref:MFS allantoate transporter n=1 Tax=Niveomyces insectorum RCEF 264 TaxID=1081102 RepID=A0A167T8H4_9HYPO|nr:MFS allantoate transporter [Niveomyces insectorum RCEF 264]